MNNAILCCVQENDRLVMELVNTTTHEYEDKLRDTVDALLTMDDLLNTDLSVYIERHDEVWMCWCGCVGDATWMCWA